MGNSTNLEPTIYNEEVPNSKKEGFNPVYRKKGQKNLVTTLDPSIVTMRDLLAMIKSKYGNNPGIGELSLIKDKFLSVRLKTRILKRLRCAP